MCTLLGASAESGLVVRLASADSSSAARGKLHLKLQELAVPHTEISELQFLSLAFRHGPEHRYQEKYVVISVKNGANHG